MRALALAAVAAVGLAGQAGAAPVWYYFTGTGDYLKLDVEIGTPLLVNQVIRANSEFVPDTFSAPILDAPVMTITSGGLPYEGYIDLRIDAEGQLTDLTMDMTGLEYTFRGTSIALTCMRAG